MQNELDLTDLEGMDLPIMPNLKQGFHDRANLVEQTDPEKLINDITHILSGDTKNDDGEWVADKQSNPLINKNGIRKLTTFLRMIINKNTIFTKYSGVDIKDLLRDQERSINDHIRANADNYGIKPNTYGLVVDMIIQPVEAAIKRSQEGVTMDFIGRATRDVNTSSELSRPQMPMYPYPERQGLLSRTVNKVFKPFNK